MALSTTESAGGAALLIEAAADPFFRLDEADEHPIQAWYSFLVETFPLSTFQTVSYEALGNPELPTTYPLAQVLLSVLEDEGWEEWQFVADEDTLFDLVYNLAARRRQLGEAETRFFSSCLVQEGEDGELRIERASALRGLTEPNPMVERDETGNLSAVSTEFERIGRELVARIEARDAAPRGSDEAKEAQEAIDEFLREISARRGRGRPPEAVEDDTLRTLYEEGTDLLEIVRRAQPLAPSAETREILAHYGIENEGAQDFWAAHLALPVLSVRELEVALQYLDDDNWMTPRRLSILFLARRLGLDPPHVARRLVGADLAEDFRNREADYPV